MSKETSTTNSRAELLIHALPYIQSFHGKTIVVKYGGNAMIDEALKAAVIQDIVMMACVGIQTVLVHGGGPEINDMLKKIGKESRFVNGLRYTDEETMEIVQMVLCGKVNKDITGLIQQAGGKAAGLCGIDGAMLKAVRKNDDLGLVGEVTQVDVSIVKSSLASGFIPVISSVALETDGAKITGNHLNVNADIAAAQIAAALKAEKLILMTDVQGIFRDINDPSSLIASISRSELDTLKKDGIISKGMIPKTDCCAIALDGGVKTHIIDGRLPHALIVELFTDEGVGTMIIP